MTKAASNLIKPNRTIKACGGFIIRILLVILDSIRELFASVDESQGESRRLHDSISTGELNHRTGKLDAGTDPHGWYDN